LRHSKGGKLKQLVDDPLIEIRWLLEVIEGHTVGGEQ